MYYSVFNFKGTTKLAFRNAEGGIWTLAPLLTTYSLSRGAPSTTWVLLHWLTHILLFCKIVIQFCTRNSSLWLRSTVSGESGIRTHAPLRTNGFQDRLVMTTSISLQSALSNVLINNTPQYHFCQAFFQVFFVFLFFSNCIQNMLFPCIAIINIWYSHVIYPINSFLLLKRIFLKV